MVRDCGGWTGAIFTWILIVGGETLVMFVLAARPLTLFTCINVFMSLFTAALGSIAHLRAMFSDPVSADYNEVLLDNTEMMYSLKTTVYIIIMVSYIFSDELRGANSHSIVV